MVSSLFHPSSTPAMLCIYKSQIRLKMEYNCHIWFGAAQSSISRLDRMQRHQNILTSYIVPSILTFRAKICHVTYTGSNNPYSPDIPLIRRKFLSDNFYPRSVICGTDSREYASLITAILTTSNLESTDIFPTYPHNLYLLLPLKFRQQ